MSLRLVSETSDQDRKRSRATEELWAPLRELAANLMRIVRGAGHPERLPRQLTEVSAAYEAYHEAFGYWPPPDVIHSSLEIEGDDPKRPPPQSEREQELRKLDEDRSYAARLVQLASLQIFASTLLDQTPQLRGGEHDFWSAFYQTRDAHDAHHRAWLEQTRATSRPRGRRPRVKPQHGSRE